MKIRLLRIIGRKLYFKCRKWEIRKQFTIRPFIRIESELYTYTIKMGNYGKAAGIGVKYYIVIGGKKNDRNIT